MRKRTMFVAVSAATAALASATAYAGATTGTAIGATGASLSYAVTCATNSAIVRADLSTVTSGFRGVFVNDDIGGGYDITLDAAVPRESAILSTYWSDPGASSYTM